MSDDFKARVLKIVAAIPYGRVMNYGQVALFAGSPLAARQVGNLLHGQARANNLPWQRVINVKGGVSTYRVGLGELQRKLLEAEGVTFDAKGYCDLSVYGWAPDDAFGEEHGLNRH